MDNIKVCHINTYDIGGGAEKFSFDFLINCPTENYLLVKEKKSTNNSVDTINKNDIFSILLILDKIFWKIGIRKLSLFKWFRNFKHKNSYHDKLNCTYNNLKKHPFYKNADIIQIHNIHGNFFDIESLIKIAKEKHIIWSMHDMWAFTGGEAYVLENENYKIGEGKTPYNGFYPLNSPEKDKRDYYIKLKKDIYSKIANKITFVPGSEWLHNCLLSAYVAPNNINSLVIKEAIDTKIFYNKKNRNWEVPRYLLVNSNNFYKGAEIFINLFSENKFEAEFYVIGNDLEIDFGKNEINKLSYITTDEELCSVLNNVDFLIFPSKQDNSPLLVTNAMSCGVCVIAMKNSGLINLLEDESGILFENNSKTDLINKIEITSKNLNKFREMGISASIRVKEQYDTKKMYENYINLYKKILKK